jgi:ferritin-like metal-binding protein YciE
MSVSIQPPRVTSPRDLLADDLKRLLTIESALAKTMLPKLIEEVDDDELKSALEKHLDETRAHVENVKKALHELDESESGKDAPALEGLKQEHDSGIADVAPELRNAFDTGAAIGSEHYEIAIYSSAVLIAESLGESKVGELIGKNLEQEFAALQKLEKIAERLAKS